MAPHAHHQIGRERDSGPKSPPLGEPDATALLEELLAKGVPLAAPREAFTKAQGQVRSFHVHDADGILMQFNGGLNEG
jgi:hypothetical protein